MSGDPRWWKVGRASRRQFLREATAAAAALAAPRVGGTARGGPSGIARLSEHVAVFEGPVNAGLIFDGDRALLIDCGDGRVAQALPALGVARVDHVVFTHHHRDQACGGRVFAEAGARIGAPRLERELFDDPAAYWCDDRRLWRVYATFRPHRLTLTEPLRVDETYADGDAWRYGAARIRVHDTPGHTDGSISYEVEADGRRWVFCGDCLCDGGRLWDVHSLQRGFSAGGRTIGAYHGFMGDRWRLAESLARLRSLNADALVPSHGRIERTPSPAIEALLERLDAGYENYVAISALRHYFPELFADMAGRPGQMPIRPGLEPPACLRHFGTTWVLVSDSGAALVMDVGSPKTVEWLKQRRAAGDIRSIDALWVTHYHADHTDGIPLFQREFDAPCIADRHVAEVIANPRAWRLPCLSPEPCRVDRPTADGESWEWEGFRLTAFHYPGQTLYHGALLAERGPLRMLFVGDSHTMAGIDDYCALNRNFLGRGVGFQRCLSLIERLAPTHIFNCHVDLAFTFTSDELAWMRRTLDRREELFGALLPWDHPNFGLDESWARCFPYTQTAAAGHDVNLQVAITNHASAPRDVAGRAAIPMAWGGGHTEWVGRAAPARSEAMLPLRLHIPDGTPAGRYVVPVDIRHGERELPQFAEAIVDVT